MKIKVSEVARRDLDALDGSVRRRVIRGLRDGLPTAVVTDQILTLADGTETRIHPFGRTDPVVIYRMVDVDSDGEDEAVVLTIIERDIVSTLTKPAPYARSLLDSSDGDPVPGPIRVARDLISKLRAAES